MTRLLTRQSLQSSMCLTNKNLVLVRIKPNILYRLRHFQVRRADEILLGTKLRPFNIEGYCILPGKKIAVSRTSTVKSQARRHNCPRLYRFPLKAFLLRLILLTL